MATWHNKPYRYEMPVEDGQEINIKIERQYHEYSEWELMDLIDKLNLKTDKLADFLEYYKNNIGFKEIDYTWDYVKDNVLTQKAKCVNVDDITAKTSGILQIAIGNTKFESVLIPSKISFNFKLC